MNEPWFNPGYSWIFGTLLGVMAGILGACMGILAPKGKAKAAMFFCYWACLLYSGACLIAGIVALSMGQPYGVWYGLTLAGVIGLLVLGLNYVTLQRVYRMAEARKMSAQNL
jgi:uncharacterized membrane protein